MVKSEVNICMAQSTMSVSQFSKDGKYFAQISIDGKVKIWETATSTFKQEFTPNLHLTTPCTCLHWITSSAQTPWKKRKRRMSESSVSEVSSNYFLSLGTSSGILLLYSFSSTQVELTIDSNTSQTISCITWEQSQEVYAGAEQFVLQFDLQQKAVKTKWKTGNDKIKSILLLPNKTRLLTASRMIQLWDVKTKEIIKTFTGHSSDVSTLQFVPTDNSESYFISGSKADRLMSCWNLNEQSQDRNAVASLLMEDTAVFLSIVRNLENSNIAVVTHSGVTHIYQIILNGKCVKPIKPKVTIQVASDSGQAKDVITPIPIIAAYFHKDSSVMIAHGNNLLLTFENVVPTFYEKIQCLIRKEPKQILSARENDVKKSKQALVDKNVDYLTPNTTENFKMKRKANDSKTEVPMEQRLENLKLNRLTTGVPKQDNVAQLLVQGLHSKDKAILQDVLCKRDETVIKNTIKRLPMQVVIPLLAELTALVKGRTLASQTGVLWLRYLVQIHASQLLANPGIVELIGPVLGIIENRLSLLTPLSRLRGRLDLLVSQISDASNKDNEVDEALLVYKDQGTSDSESDENIELNLHSESENEWVEEENTENDDEEENEVIEENNVSDSDMSM